MRFMKSFGLGILYTLFSPLILAVCIVIGLGGIVNFFVQFVLMLINFFKGKKLFPVFEEDVQALKILNASFEQKAGQIAQQQAQPQQGNTFIQQNFYAAPGQPFPGLNNQGLPNPSDFKQVGTSENQNVTQIEQSPIENQPIDVESEK